MRLHWLQHVPFEGLGIIEKWAIKKKTDISLTRLYDGEPLPGQEQFDWLVVMGGPMGVGDEKQFPWLTREKKFIENAIKEGKTVIGICLGAQIIADVLGAKIYKNKEKEIGWLPVDFTPEGIGTLPFSKFPSRFTVFHWHGDTFDIPEGAVHAAKSEACENQAFVYDSRVLGLQFHMETTMESAKLLIENCASDITEGPFIQQPEEMVSTPPRFIAINATMQSLLDSMAE